MDNFFDALKRVVSVIPKKISYPPLGVVLLRGNGEELEMSAINDELDIKIVFPCNYKLDCCLDGKLLYDFLRTTNNAHLIQGEHCLLIETDNSNVELPIYSNKEFIQFPEIEGDKISVYARDIKNAFRMVNFIPAREWHQDFRASILLDYIHRFLRIAASDDQRLGVFGTLVEVREKIADRKVLISKDTVLNLEKTLPDDGEINIYFAKNGIFWEDKNGETVFTRLVNGEFPDYEKVLPKDETTFCSFNIQREALLEALNRVALISDIAQIKTGDSLEIFGESEKGKIKEIIEIFDNKGNAEANYNIQYLLQPLSRMNAETVQAKISSYNMLSFNVEQYVYVLSSVERNES